MSIRPAWALALAVSLALPAFATEGEKAAPAADNPFFQPSTLPYQFPPFDRITDAHYLPAFERGMALYQNCQKALDEAELRVDMLLKGNDPGGRVRFDPETP